MDSSNWSVWGAKLVESLLLLCNREHCSAKKELKSPAFWWKSVIKLQLWYIGEMIGIVYYSQNFVNGPISFRASFWIWQFHQQRRVVFTFCIFIGRGYFVPKGFNSFFFVSTIFICSMKFLENVFGLNSIYDIFIKLWWPLIVTSYGFVGNEIRKYIINGIIEN